MLSAAARLRHGIAQDRRRQAPDVHPLPFRPECRRQPGSSDPGHGDIGIAIAFSRTDRYIAQARHGAASFSDFAHGEFTKDD
jgi:hypothetical protein